MQSRFNPRPREGSDFLRILMKAWEKCFNPRPREGSDAGPSLDFAVVSTVSIRAPAKGAIIRTVRPLALLVCFNPRPREGSDETVRCIGARGVVVSIRAPAKGVIQALLSQRRFPELFQSAPPRRERWGLRFGNN